MLYCIWTIYLVFVTVWLISVVAFASSTDSISYCIFVVNVQDFLEDQPLAEVTFSCFKKNTKKNNAAYGVKHKPFFFLFLSIFIGHCTTIAFQMLLLHLCISAILLNRGGQIDTKNALSTCSDTYNFLTISILFGRL